MGVLAWGVLRGRGMDDETISDAREAAEHANDDGFDGDPLKSDPEDYGPALYVTDLPRWKAEYVRHKAYMAGK